MKILNINFEISHSSEFYNNQETLKFLRSITREIDYTNKRVRNDAEACLSV